MPVGFYLLIAAQFLSSLADNALLIVTIGLLQAQGWPAWWAPLLKFGFTLAYVVLAPAVGDLADAFPKARLMAWMNGLKLLGAAALLGSVHPVLAFAIVGLGAAAYAPAKYGLVTESVPPRQLVAANGWIEVSVVSSALLGTGLGGLLVSQAWLALPVVLSVQEFWAACGGLDSPLTVSLAVLVLPVLASLQSLSWALLTLVCAGAMGGLMVVPLNALLQHRGHVLLSAGRSIAVQGFNENASILVMLSVYAALLAWEVPIVSLMWGMGLAVAGVIGGLMWRLRRFEPPA